MLHIRSRTIRSKVFKQICDRITFTLEFTCIERNSTGCLWPYTYCVINIIWPKTTFFNFFHREIFCQLMNDRGNHFQVCQFLSANIIQHCHGHAIWHSKTLRKITHRCSDLAIRSTRLQYPIIPKIDIFQMIQYSRQMGTCREFFLDRNQIFPGLLSSYSIHFQYSFSGLLISFERIDCILICLSG